jgi:hypothetical protein
VIVKAEESWGRIHTSYLDKGVKRLPNHATMNYLGRHVSMIRIHRVISNN